MFYVYLILYDNNSIYVGFTNNSPRRLQDHRTKSGGWHTKIHKVIKILYIEKFATKKETLTREKQLKGWTKLKKKL